MHTGLYIGWTGYNNLGDEVMFAVCQQRFAEFSWLPFEAWNARPDPKGFAHRAMRSPTLLFKSLADELRTGRRLRGFINSRHEKTPSNNGVPMALLGGGTLINATDEFFDWYKAAREKLRSPVPIFGCGVKPPEFFSGKGEWRDRSREWVDATGDLPVVGVRGPFSKQLLESVGARNVVISGDPACWLHQPLQNSDKTHPDRPLRIGINCGTARYIWGSVDRVLATQAEAARQLSASGHAVELFAICPEDMAACEEVARQAGAGITPLSYALTDYESYEQKMADLDVVIAFKLHAAVLAACANVPFVMLEYQPKCRDFCASIDWEDYNLRTDQADPASILDRLSQLRADLPATRQSLCRKMCELRSTFDEYCGRLEEMLLQAAVS